jgi:hypothetical protein
MKRFLYKISLFSFLLFSVLACLILNLDGYTDEYYLRLTSPKQQNLIVGTSRAAQGLNPTELKEGLAMDLYNFSFTLGHSPFGPTYLNAIKEKLDTTNKNQLFIIAVDPWSISAVTDSSGSSEIYGEENLFLGKIPSVNRNPNLSYVYQNVKPRYKLLYDKYNFSFLHANGWLEIDVKMDSASVTHRKVKKLKNYRNVNSRKYQISNTRIEYLNKAINYFKKYGTVIMVRLPISKEMIQIEESYSPDFRNQIASSILLCDFYLDLSAESEIYQFTDGNHLHRESSQRLSENLGFKIAELIQK